MANPTEDRFLGALLGLAIGDALGMPVTGLSAPEIAERGGVDGYLPRPRPGDEDVEAGEITEKTESALAIAESLTTGGGRVDPDLAGPRLVHLATGPSRHWFPEETRAALVRAGESLDFSVPLDEDAPAALDVLARGIPVGLAHSVGKLDAAALREDCERAVRLSHGSTRSISAATAVALVIRLAAAGDIPPERWPEAVAAELGECDLARELLRLQAIPPGRWPELDARAELGADTPATAAALEAIALAASAERFENAVFAAVRRGGPADALGGLTGAFAGARFGSSGIPQGLIDGLGCRIYVSLAAPWLLKAARLRSGQFIDLRPRLGGPRPDQPPRI